MKISNKQALLFLACLALSLGLIFSERVEIAQSAPAGSLIKAKEASSVYYLGDDNKRYVFPSESVYFSWYKDFKDVVTISAAELQSYQLGKNVVMRAGTKLVKITTDPSVYAVEPGGKLRKIQNENQAQSLYGDRWAQRVVDVADSLFTDYIIGNALGDNELPVGSLVKNPDAELYYYYDGSSFRQIRSAGDFLSNRFYSENIIKFQFPSASIGEPITSSGSELTALIKWRATNYTGGSAINPGPNNTIPGGGNLGGGGGGGGTNTPSPVCSGAYTQNCSITNGQGTQTRTCSGGTWSGWGACALTSCLSGYQPNGDNSACVVSSCSGSSSQSCAITNGQGSQTRTCSGGAWSGWGQCGVTSCDPGYQPSGNSCVALTCNGESSQPCPITNGQGIQTRECSLGAWSGWGTCTLTACNPGYTASGNACVLIAGDMTISNLQKMVHGQDFAIPSNAENGDVVGTLNVFWKNWENRSLNYSIVNGNGTFSIDNGGKIALLNKNNLSGQSEIIFTVRAEDQARQEYETASIKVTVLPIANTYFIDPSVSVSGNGSRENPYKSWGDVNFASNRNYLQKRGTNADISSQININNFSGIVIGAYGSAESRPKISGWNLTGSSNGAMRMNGSNNTIRDLEIDARLSTSGIYIGSSTNNTIDNCLIQNSEWAIRTMVSGSYTKIINSEIAYTGDDGHYNQNHNNLDISHNYFHHVNQKWNENSYWYSGKSENQSPGDAIQLNGTAFDFNIHHNIFDRSDTDNKFCILIGLTSSPNDTHGLIEHNYCKLRVDGNESGFYIERGAVGIKVRYNTLTGDTGIFTHAGDLLIAYNVFLNSRVYVGEPGASYKVYNNVFYSPSGSNAVSLWRDNIDLKNNIFFFANSSASGLQTSSQFTVNTGYNLYYPDFRGNGASASNLTTDPLFINASSGDFRLQSNSPAIGAGTVVGETHDFFGNSLGASVNIGISQ